MRIIVKGSDKELEMLMKDSSTGVEWVREHASLDDNASAYFYFSGVEPGIQFPGNKPVFINSVIFTLAELNAPANAVRFNGWNGFVERQGWEIAGLINDDVNAVMQQINKTAVPVADETGLVAPRVLSMIINEAYFALEEAVSSREDIDIAMKLGTNYPFGPFEWAALAGLNNIHALLLKLSETDKRYLPAPLLTRESATA
jgi:3-hydroxybutyryl-CoA dehydrogenase